MISKKGIEFSFAWIFAMIAGAVILFLAIYAATNFVKTERLSQDTLAGKQIGVILTPLENGIASSTYVPLKLSTETRLYSECDSTGSFGVQSIRIATASGIGKKWEEPGAPAEFYNKYLFSEGPAEGKNLFVMMMPLNMPFKIADLTLLWGERKDYCFVSPPKDIEDTIKKDSLFPIVENENECSEKSYSVCFEGQDCDVVVDLNAKSVKKNGKKVYYDNNLIYGAILADSGLYECQLKRLMKRASELSYVYLAKGQRLNAVGCTTNIENELGMLGNATFAYNSSQQLRQISMISEEIRRINDGAACKLF